MSWYNQYSLERDVKSAEVTFAKCPTATKHKNQEENNNMLPAQDNFAAMMVISSWVTCHDCPL